MMLISRTTTVRVSLRPMFLAMAAVAMAMLLLLTMNVASAQTPAKPSAPATPPAATGAGTPPATMAAPDGPAKPANADANYIIGPGDTLQVYVWRNPELTTTVPVRPDGKISTPLVEDMVAVGKTPAQLARDVEKVLSEYVRGPQVNIIVTGAVSTYNQVSALGQVKNPRSVPYRDGLKVMDLLLQAGGLTDFASGNRAKIVREVNGKQQEIRVKLDDLLNKGAMKNNVTLRPGDVLVVPESFF